MSTVKKFDEFVHLFERELPDYQGKILVIMGPPGSGKGTFSKRLSDKEGYNHISTGDLIRKSKDPELKAKIAQGEFIDDKTMLAMLRKEVKKMDPGKGIIFDGFPRTVKQAGMLDSMLGKMGLGLSHTIYLDLDEKTATDRILSRAEKENRADDKDPEIVKKRFRTYEEKTAPLIELYQKSRKLKKFDSGVGIDRLYKKIVNQLDLKKSESSTTKSDTSSS
jgi:adenylate kinase